MRSRGSVERCEIMADMDEEQVSIRFSDVIEANGVFWVVSWWRLVGTEVPYSEDGKEGA